jgi:hypothetical protein
VSRLAATENERRRCEQQVAIAYDVHVMGSVWRVACDV